MPRGGYYPNAERWGRKSAWRNDSVTKTIRVPEKLAEQVLDYAHKLDDGGITDYETKAKNEVEQLKIELEQVRQERNRLAAELAANQASQSQQPDLEAIRDRVLAGLKLGKQAPEYKRTKKAIDSFIAFVQSL